MLFFHLINTVRTNFIPFTILYEDDVSEADNNFLKSQINIFITELNKELHGIQLQLKNFYSFSQYKSIYKELSYFAGSDDLDSRLRKIRDKNIILFATGISKIHLHTCLPAILKYEFFIKNTESIIFGIHEYLKMLFRTGNIKKMSVNERNRKCFINYK